MLGFVKMDAQDFPSTWEKPAKQNKTRRRSQSSFRMLGNGRHPSVRPSVCYASLNLRELDYYFPEVSLCPGVENLCNYSPRRTTPSRRRRAGDALLLRKDKHSVENRGGTIH